MLGRFSIGWGLMGWAVLLSAGDCLADGPAQNNKPTSGSDPVQEIEEQVGPPQRYPVGDLIYDRHGKLDLGGLVHTIRQVTEESSWDNLGGSGRIGYHDEQLFILHTDAVHAKIEALLRTLRKAKQAQQEVSENNNPITSVLIDSEHCSGNSRPAREYHRLYPVADLVTGGQPLADFNLNPWHLAAEETALGQPVPSHVTDHSTQHYQEILSMLAECVTPRSWGQNAGRGWGLPSADSIVVFQSAENHEVIEALLADIRAHRQTENSQTGPTAEPTSPYVIRTYYPTRLGIERKVTRDYLEAVGRRIQRAIEPESWHEGPAFLDVYEGRIVVCQREDLQARIQQLIQVCGIIGPDIPHRFITFDRSQDGRSETP